MRIRPRYSDDTPEINLIPLIDVLLVILIFLAVSTTFSTERSIEVSLPQAQAEAQLPKTVELTITSSGEYAVAGRLLPDNSLLTLTETLRKLPESQQETVLIIRADANATHQSVVSAMQAATRAGLSRISFAARLSD